MRLASPNSLWWLLLAAIILFFYLLKLKRKRTVVPTVFLWKRALDELEANAPFKKLRRNLLLLLQLLILGALVFALARPLISVRAVASGSTIIILDSTASMNARDEDGSSRLYRAKQIARDIVASLSVNDRAAILESSARVSVRCALTSDRATLVDAIENIQETEAAGTLDEASRLAEQMAKSERDATILIISDGGGVEPSSDSRSLKANPASATLRFIRVGRRADNVGIIAMNSRQLPETGRREVFASIANFSERARNLGLELRVEDRLIDARTIDVGANDKRSVVFESVPGDDTLAELKLDIEDDLSADNVAYTFLPGTHRLRVGVVSENPFVLQALAADTNIDASKISAGSITSDFDCIVSDGASITGNRPLLAINPTDAPGFLRTIGQRERPEFSSQVSQHPVNRFLSYADLHLESLPVRETAPWLKPIVAFGNDPAIWAGEDNHRRIVVIGFDLTRSDLPLKIEFPLLISNSLLWLTHRDSLSSDRTVRTGQPITLGTPEATAAITTPAGDTVEVHSSDGSIVFADTLRAGKYTFNNGPTFAASLLSRSESDTTPQDSISTRAGELNGQAETLHSEREVWWWLALAGLLALMIEWWIYHRRAFV